MLISHMSEEGNNAEAKGTDMRPESDSEGYESANALFELMAQNQNFRPGEDGTLTAKDLVLIYKNIDLGNRLMSNANELKRKSGNQYVETIIYEDPESDSDMSEVFSAEDLHNLVLINDERLQLMKTPVSLENTLCQKFGEVNIQSTTAGSVNYNRNFIFKDPYIKEQLKHMNIDPDTNNAIGALPATLLDVICCKRLEDNYNFYMDNIIKYVKHTIDQLEKISNGDYLTERAKEVWKEVGEEFKSSQLSNYLKVQKNSTVLATSTSIPLHVQRKSNGCESLWEEIVHSELDIKSLSKILQKQIVLEVPKSICGTFKFFSECYDDNFIIRCKKEQKEMVPEKKKQRMDVVVKLKRSESGHVMSNIHSIVFLQKDPIINEHVAALPLPQSNDEIDENSPTSHPIQIVNTEPKESTEPIQVFNNEIDIETPNKDTESIDHVDYHKRSELNQIEEKDVHIEEEKEVLVNDKETQRLDSNVQNCFYEDTLPIKLSRDSVGNNTNCTNDTLCSGDSARPALTETTEIELYSDRDVESAINNRFAVDAQTSDMYICSNTMNSTKPDSDCYFYGQWDGYEEKSRLETAYKLMPPGELRLAIQRLNMQDSLPEDPAEGNVSPFRKRSPTIRIKSPYENKSYVLEEKKRKKLLEIRQRREKKKIALSESCKTVAKNKGSKGIIMPQTSSSVTKISISNKSFYNSIYGQHQNVSTETNGKARIKIRKITKDATADQVLRNKSARTDMFKDDNSPDDTMTEMMYIKLQSKLDDDDTNGTMYSETGTTVALNDYNGDAKNISHLMIPKETSDDTIDSLDQMPIVDSNLNVLLSMNFPEMGNTDRRRSPKKANATGSKNKTTPVDFRKSIDQIYDLISKPEKLAEGHPEITLIDESTSYSVKNCKSSLSHCSDSETSLKHNNPSSNPSFFSFSKINGQDAQNNSPKSKFKTSTPVIPKVIISSKTSKTDKDNTKKERVNMNSSPPTLNENPLKAISKILHEFDNVQKAKVKIAEKNKKYDVGEPKISPRPALRKVRVSIGIKDTEQPEGKPTKIIEKNMRSSVLSPRDRKQKQIHTIVDPPEDRLVIRVPKKQVTDIVDEYKEAKGEAVRGPPKLLSARLNSLAQPRKHYVQAQFEELQSKHGKNFMSDRLQRMAAPSSSQASTTIRQKTPNKMKQKNDTLAKNAAPPTEKTVRFKSVVNNGKHEPILAMANDPSKYGHINDRHLNDDSTANKKRLGAIARQRPTAPIDLVKEHLRSNVPFSCVTSTDCGDFDFPFEESTKIAKKLHTMIDSIVKPSLTVLPECNERNSQLLISDGNEGDLSYVCSKNDDHDLKIELQESCDSSTGLNHNSINEGNKKAMLKRYNNISGEDSYALPSFRSVTEIANFHHLMPAGTFQKRLSSLSPTQSLRHILLMQSGDASSVIVKSTISQELDKCDSMSELKALSEIQKSTFDWTFTQVPMQITTVGYGFSKYNFDPEILRRVTKNQGTKGSAKGSSSLSIPYSENMSLENYKSELKCISCATDKEKCIKKNESSYSTTRKATDNDDTVKIKVPETLFRNPNVTKPDIGSNTKRPLISDIILEDSLENILDKCATPNENQKISAIETKLHDILEENEVTNSVPKSDSSCMDKKSIDGIEYTTSLDILVGLLNEIKNITTCQTQMTGVKNDQNVNGIEPDGITYPDVYTKNHTQNKLHPTDISDAISFTTLDKLRQLESNPSIYSYILSNDEDNENCEDELNASLDMPQSQNASLNLTKLSYSDKEIGTSFSNIQVVCHCTDAPSFQKFLPISVNHASTTISRSVISANSKSSNESCTAIVIYDDCESNHTISNLKYHDDNIVDLYSKPVEKNKEDLESIELGEEHFNISRKPINEYPQIIMKDRYPKTSDEEPMNIHLCQPVEENTHLRNMDQYPERIVEALSKKELDLSQQNNCSTITTKNFFASENDFDPTIKIKRDILVTIYSVLVFTVFAALSFPQMIYQ